LELNQVFYGLIAVIMDEHESHHWHLIYNKFKVLIDPFYFASRDMAAIQTQVNLVTMLHDYLDKTEPSLCDVLFHYPKYIEDRLNMRRVFNSLDKKIVEVEEPKQVVDFFNAENTPDEDIRKHANEILSIAIENKLPFVLSNLDIKRKEEVDLISKYNITFIKHEPLQKKIEAFLQGFYNYYKFDVLYGIDSPDIAHAMRDELHKKLYVFENKVKLSSLSDAAKERVRSFVHNRYIDILVTIDKITFYKVQQQLSDIERGVLENKNSQFHGSIRYHLNYYLLLLWGYVDHMCLIINDIFEFGYDEETDAGRRMIGFRNFKNKREYLGKLKAIDEDFYNFILTKEFQEWLDVLGQLRHKNAHREMISPSPLLQPTPESEISDAEIDAIIYKDKPPVEERAARLLPPSAIEYQKVLDRHHYKISKMKKLYDHVAIVKGGFLDPVARIEIDMENLNKLTNHFLKAANKAKILL
jgi:hypothetical protein